MTEPIDNAEHASESASASSDYQETALYKALQNRRRMPKEGASRAACAPVATSVVDSVTSPITIAHRPSYSALRSEGQRAVRHRSRDDVRVRRRESGLIRRCTMLGVDIGRVLEAAARNAAVRLGMNPNDVV